MPISEYLRGLREKVGHDLLLWPGVTAIIINEDDHVLLQRRAEDGQWGMPGGMIDPDESPADAVVREAWEETGLLVEPTHVAGVYGGPDFHVRYPNGDEISFASIAFACRVIGGELRPDGEETLELGYFSPDQLRELQAGSSQASWLGQALARHECGYFQPSTWQLPADGVRAAGISDYFRWLRDKVGKGLLMSVGAAAIIFDEQGRVLMQRRGDTGMWGIPGGAMDPCELPADAVVRETWEETGLLVEPVRVVGVFGGPDLHIAYPNGDEVSVIATVFECRVIGGNIDPDGEETLELAYFSPEEVLNKLAISERIRSRIAGAVTHRDRVLFDPPTWSLPE